MAPAVPIITALAAIPVGMAAGVFAARWPAGEAPAASWVAAGVAMAVPCAAVAGVVLEGAAGALMLATLVPVVVVDLRCRLVPDVLVLPVITALLVMRAIAGPGPWWSAPVAAVAVGGMLMLPALVCPAGMGMGDAKLAVLLGAGLGIAGGIAVLVALLAGAAWGAVLAAVRGRATLRQAIPFAPFIAVGAVVALAGASGATEVRMDASPAAYGPRATGRPHHHGEGADVPARLSGIGMRGRGRDEPSRARPTAAGRRNRPDRGGMLRHSWRLPTAQPASPTARPSPRSLRACPLACRSFPTTSMPTSRVASWGTAAGGA